MRIAATDPMSRGSSTHNCNNRRGNEEIIRMGKEMRKGSLARRMAATDERIWPRCSLFSTRQTDANSSASNVRGVTPPLEVRVSRLLISDWRNENEARRPLGNVMFSVTLWRRWRRRWRGRPLQHSLHSGESSPLRKAHPYAPCNRGGGGGQGAHAIQAILHNCTVRCPSNMSSPCPHLSAERKSLQWRGNTTCSTVGCRCFQDKGATVALVA